MNDLFRSRGSVSRGSMGALFAALVALGGCGGENPGNPSTGGGSGDGGATGDGGNASDGGGGSGGAPLPQPMKKTLSGDATWQVTFDATAQAAGATNCSYTRHYEAVEDATAPWLCPGCEVMYQATVQMTAGLEDCYPQVSGAPPATNEWLGYENGVWRRGLGGPLTDQGSITTTGDQIALTNLVEGVEASVGGTLSFNVTGNFTLGETPGDPNEGFIPPATYACGWPKADPPPYTGDYVLSKGGILPDGVFLDACEEAVRLHDLKGAYLIVEMAARDCPPCQAMAEEEEQFIADMAAQGIEVEVVTLLAPSLSDVLGKTTTPMLKNWVNNFSLTSPVLADRGWGISIFEPAIGADQLGYPSWTIVTPELVVLDYATGFGTFDDFKNIILADAMP